VPALGLRMGIICPPRVKRATELHAALRKREVLRWMKIRPVNFPKCEVWLDDLKSERSDINIQRTVKEGAQIQAPRLKDWDLPIERSARIVLGRSGGHSISFSQDAADGLPFGVHVRNSTLCGAEGAWQPRQILGTAPYAVLPNAVSGRCMLIFRIIACILGRPAALVVPIL